MNGVTSPDQLRELFLSAQDPTSVRVLALVCSLTLVAVVLTLVRRGRLREEYTPIWMGVALMLAIVTIRIDLLRELTRALGAWSPSSVLFFLGQAFLVAICLHYAVHLSRTNTRLKDLAQEVAILRAELDRASPRTGSGVPAAD